jgi:RNA polymerase sigma-70 factor (ECF subfamily)
MREQELVKLARQGDRDAYAALVEKYRIKMFNLAYSMTRNREEADDITQDVFIKAWRHISGFQGRSAFGTWIYRIAVNTIRDNLRRENRFPRIPLEDHHAEAGSGENLIRDREADAELESRRARLHRALRSLPEKYRTILTLRDIQGLQYNEISRILGLSPGTVDSRLFRARRRLRKAISQPPHLEGEDHALS